jgi:hypothetical protein
MLAKTFNDIKYKIFLRYAINSIDSPRGESESPTCRNQRNFAQKGPTSDVADGVDGGAQT